MQNTFYCYAIRLPAKLLSLNSALNHSMKNRAYQQDLNPSAARLSSEEKTRHSPHLPHGRIGFVGIVNIAIW
jgi:hypothetical protein